MQNNPLLEYCRQCGHLVAKTAPACPVCGKPPGIETPADAPDPDDVYNVAAIKAPRPKKKGHKVLIGAAIAFGFVALVMAAAPPDKATPGAAPTVEAVATPEAVPTVVAKTPLENFCDNQAGGALIVANGYRDRGALQSTVDPSPANVLYGPPPLRYYKRIDDAIYGNPYVTPIQVYNVYYQECMQKVTPDAITPDDLEHENSALQKLGWVNLKKQATIAPNVYVY
jgi:uncharacterized OB-fold protein